MTYMKTIKPCASLHYIYPANQTSDITNWLCDIWAISISMFTG